MSELNPLVSIIIPNYCHAKYLDKRIQSVLNQTYENFEVIILDDCSPDDGASRAVIEKYRSNPHVSHIVYNETNGGSPYKQWHKGACLAKGDLLWIAESDDYCDENFLDVLVPQFADSDVVVSFCRTMHFSDDKILGPAYPQELKDGVYEGEDFIRKYCILKTGIVNASCAVFRRDVFYSISDIYTTFTGASDKLFWVEILENGKVAFVDKPYNFFRSHPNNSSKTMTFSGLNQIEDKRIYDYLCEHGHIKKSEEYAVKYEFLKRNVFELHTDKKIQQEIYAVWGWSRWDQVRMRLNVWIDNLIKLLTR